MESRFDSVYYVLSRHLASGFRVFPGEINDDILVHLSLVRFFHCSHWANNVCLVEAFLMNNQSWTLAFQKTNVLFASMKAL